MDTNDSDFFLNLIKKKEVKLLINLINNKSYNNNIFNQDIINQWSILHYACFLKPSKNLNNLIILLINIGLSINLKDKKGQTPIHLACYNDNINIVKYVIENCNFNINDVDYDGDTLIINSSSLNYTDLSLFLIDSNSNLKLCCKKKLSPLHWSCFHLNFEVSQALINKNIDINIKNQYGDTPLHFACMSFNINFLIFLISNGANIYIKNNKNISALDLCNNINNLKKKNYHNVLIKEQNWYNRKNYAFFLNSLKNYNNNCSKLIVFYNLHRTIASYL